MITSPKNDLSLASVFVSANPSFSKPRKNQENFFMNIRCMRYIYWFWLKNVSKACFDQRTLCVPTLQYSVSLIKMPQQCWARSWTPTYSLQSESFDNHNKRIKASPQKDPKSLLRAQQLPYYMDWGQQYCFINPSIVVKVEKHMIYGATLSGIALGCIVFYLHPKLTILLPGCQIVHC